MQQTWLNTFCEVHFEEKIKLILNISKSLFFFFSLGAVNATEHFLRGDIQRSETLKLPEKFSLKNLTFF